MQALPTPRARPWAAGKVDDERPPSDTCDAATQHRHRRFRQAVGAHRLRQAGSKAIDHRERRLRRDVSIGEAGTAGRQDKVEAALVGPGAQRLLDGRLVVGDDGVLSVLVLWRTECFADQRSARILTFAPGPCVAARKNAYGIHSKDDTTGLADSRERIERVVDVAGHGNLVVKSAAYDALPVYDIGHAGRAKPETAPHVVQLADLPGGVSDEIERQVERIAEAVERVRIVRADPHDNGIRGRYRGERSAEAFGLSCAAVRECARVEIEHHVLPSQV